MSTYYHSYSQIILAFLGCKYDTVFMLHLTKHYTGKQIFSVQPRDPWATIFSKTWITKFEHYCLKHKTLLFSSIPLAKASKNLLPIVPAICKSPVQVADCSTATAANWRVLQQRTIRIFCFSRYEYQLTAARERKSKASMHLPISTGKQS